MKFFVYVGYSSNFQNEKCVEKIKMHILLNFFSQLSRLLDTGKHCIARQVQI